MFNPILQYGDLTGLDSMAAGGITAGIIAMVMAFLVVFLVIGIAVYIYMALAMMKVAKRLKVEPAWLAWVPIGNMYLMLKMAKMPALWMLLLIGCIIPYVGFIASIALMVIFVMAMYKICEARQRPGWWALLQIVPFLGSVWSLIMWGILAWGK